MLNTKTGMVDKAELIKRIQQQAREKQVRWTDQRKVIIERFIESDHHISVEDLHQSVRQIDPSVSPATVYRTMNLLVDIGMAVKRNFSEGSAHFELIVDREHHDHLIDVDSGDVHEFTNEEIEELQHLVAKQLGYDLVDHRLVLYGKRLKQSDEV